MNEVAQKPKSAVLAVKLLWVSLAIGLIPILMDFSVFNNTETLAFTSFILIFTFGLLGFLFAKISAGKNWARVTFLVLFIIGGLPGMFLILERFSRSSFVGILSVVQIGLQGYALFLLFTQPGSSWFRKTVGG